MNNWFSKVKKFAKQVLGLLPTPLPQGMAAYEEYVASLQATYSLPSPLKDDISFAVASEIIRLGPQVTFYPKYKLVRAIRSGAAKQIAGAAMYEIKQRQKAAQTNAVQPQ